MINAIKKTTDVNGIYHYIVNGPDASYPTVDWEHNPDISGVSGVSENYWKYDGSNVVVEMSTSEKDAVDSMLVDIETMNAEPIGNVITDEQVYNGEETKVITLPTSFPNIIVHVMDPKTPSLLNSELLSASATPWDVFNRSTNEASINNGSYVDLAYNNTSAGNTSGFILGVDMGTPTAITAMKMWDYSTAYYNTEWEFIGTNTIGSPFTYTVIFNHTQNTPYLDPNPFFTTFTEQTYRYYGLRCVTSNNVTYSIWRELELYSGTPATVEKKLTVNNDYEYSMLSDNEICIKNLKSTSRTLKTVIVGTTLNTSGATVPVVVDSVERLDSQISLVSLS